MNRMPVTEEMDVVEGLYSSHLVNWRRQRDQGELGAARHRKLPSLRSLSSMGLVATPNTEPDGPTVRPLRKGLYYLAGLVEASSFSIDAEKDESGWAPSMRSVTFSRWSGNT